MVYDVPLGFPAVLDHASDGCGKQPVSLCRSNKFPARREAASGTLLQSHFVLQRSVRDDLASELTNVYCECSSVRPMTGEKSRLHCGVLDARGIHLRGSHSSARRRTPIRLRHL